MRALAFLACAGYWSFLTVLLLVSDPAGLGGMQAVPVFPWGKFGVHLIAFTGLGFLANAGRWRSRPCWSLIAFLVLYGVTTESLQLLVPCRTARVMDGIENILGIAAGSLFYWTLVWLIPPNPKLNLAAALVRCPAPASAASK